MLLTGFAVGFPVRQFHALPEIRCSEAGERISSEFPGIVDICQRQRHKNNGGIRRGR
jgi:hypothetical protein